jgi:hypothetical protein
MRDLQRSRGLQTSVLVSESGVRSDFGKFAEILQVFPARRPVKAIFI